MTDTANRTFRNELLLALFLIALGVAGRTLPHLWNLSPVAAAALFAGRTFHTRVLAFAVPVAAMLLGDLILGFDKLPLEIVVYASMLLPVAAGIATRRWRGAAVVTATMLSCSLIFFVASNFAVWAFTGIYQRTLEGLTACFIAAIPFLEKTVVGDLIWTAVLFGGAWLLRTRQSAMPGRTA